MKTRNLIRSLFVIQIVLVTFFALSAGAQRDPLSSCKRELSFEALGIQGGRIELLDNGTNLWVVDLDNSQFFAEADLWRYRGDPYVTFHFKLRALDQTGTEIERSKNLSGKEIFNAMVTYFDRLSKRIYGHEISRIYARWDLSSDNTKLMNRIHLEQPDLPLEQIARQTWTGQQALSLGFSKIKIEVARTDNGGKSYQLFRVSFWRPAYFSDG